MAQQPMRMESRFTDMLDSLTLANKRGRSESMDYERKLGRNIILNEPVEYMVSSRRGQPARQPEVGQQPGPRRIYVPSWTAAIRL